MGDLFSGGGADPQLIRGVGLLVVAVLIGAFLLWQGFDDGAPTAIASDDQSTTDATADDVEPTISVIETTTTAAPAARPPGEVPVLVATGVDIGGVATQFTGVLDAAGYVTSDPGTADNQDYSTSAVFYLPGFEAEAAAVASAIGIDASSVQPMPDPPPTRDGDLRDASVLVVIGTDLAG